jgi:A/G-specific adenine glycosylase
MREGYGANDMTNEKMKSERRRIIQKNILTWYRKNGRHDLPWRNTQDLYHIFVSEIMLQQTNVPKVIDKYKEFIDRFPSVSDLANAKQSSVITLWQGLGYNRRAIYLHRSAQEIIDRYNGHFPESHQELCTLPGVGPYTARAVLIFARNQNIVTHDVNIVRIISRTEKKGSVSEKQISRWTTEFLPKGRSCAWHSALMDFASMICTKRSPQCQMCPIRRECRSFPCPVDDVISKRKEIGWTECGKHVPRRIYRGRIIQYLRHSSGTISEIGVAIKKDWTEKKDVKWCKDVLDILEKEKLIICKKGRWMLQ